MFDATIIYQVYCRVHITDRLLLAYLSVLPIYVKYSIVDNPQMKKIKDVATNINDSMSTTASGTNPIACFFVCGQGPTCFKDTVEDRNKFHGDNISGSNFESIQRNKQRTNLVVGHRVFPVGDLVVTWTRRAVSHTVVTFGLTPHFDATPQCH